MEDLSLHILDIAENSIAAGAWTVEIRIVEDEERDRLVIEIIDDGRGMDVKTQQQALDPFFTTKEVRRVGLGLPLLKEAARAANGDLTIESKPGEGTRVTAIFQLSHIDLQPMGDMARTLETLVIGHPEVRFIYAHQREGQTLTFDSAQIRSESD